MTQHMRESRSEPDLRLPDHRQDDGRRAGAFVHAVGAVAGAIGVGLVALVYLVGAPFIALATGTAQIVVDIRDNAVRPRPFVGARHGFPFLDPPVLAAVPIETHADAEG